MHSINFIKISYDRICNTPQMLRLAVSGRLFSSSSDKNINKDVIYERYDSRILNYIRQNEHFHATTVNVKNASKIDVSTRKELDYFFHKKSILRNRRTDILPLSVLKSRNSNLLPNYIISLGERNIKQNILWECDFQCSRIPEINSDVIYFSSLKILDAWLHILEPEFHRVTELRCYSSLIQHSAREIIANSSSFSSSSVNVKSSGVYSVIQLSFVAGMGKKKRFESHEVLSQIANFCFNNCSMYNTWTSFELAVVCMSFFRSGIQVQDENFLVHASECLCEILENACSEPNGTLDISVLISILKVLRHADFVNERLLSLLGKLIMDKEKEKILRDVTVLSHLTSAFCCSGKRKMTSDAVSDLSLARVLKRVEHLVADSGVNEEDGQGYKKYVEEVHPLVKSRLKDISRWLWTAASLGYQIRPQAYQEDLSRRFSLGEFSRETQTAVEALLALAVMNHYPDLIVTKVLHSLDFRSVLKVRCQNRQKARLGLFLTLVKIERNDLWRQLTPQDVSQLEDVVGHWWNENDEWNTEPFHHKPRDKATVSSMDGDNTSHSELLNQCMDALKTVFAAKKSDNNNNISGNRGADSLYYSTNGDHHACARKDRAKIYAGQKIPLLSNRTKGSIQETTKISRVYAVPYLFIPGIRIHVPFAGKDLCLEVLDKKTFYTGWLLLKLRLLPQLGFAVLHMTPEEIQTCPDLAAFLELNIHRILQV